MSETDATSAGDEVIQRVVKLSEALRGEVGKLVVGQQGVIDLLIITLLCRGHGLLEGPPGLAKTLLVGTLAKALGLTYSRIQFTPDLMPGDITGAEIIEEDRATGQRSLRFMEGPLFAQVILADEINRTPPKTQAALLEAMQEGQVTVGRVRRTLGEPFLVLATQNPIEQEGTYPLPEAQQDRFMFKAELRYPPFEDEVEVARRTTVAMTAEVEPVCDAAELVELQRLVRTTPISDHLIRYTVALVRGTRVGQPEAHPAAVEQLTWGAGPRAVQCLILGAKARALMNGRAHVTLEDVHALAKPALRHRVLTSFVADTNGVSADEVIDQLIAETPTDEGALEHDPRFRGVLAG